MLDEYRDNEVRADGKFKGKLVQVIGTVGEIKKDLTGNVYATVGTGAEIEVPVLQCFASATATADFAALSRGQVIAMRGRVDGLMMNVLAKDCTIHDPMPTCTKLQNAVGEGECKVKDGKAFLLLRKGRDGVFGGVPEAAICLSPSGYAEVAEKGKQFSWFIGSEKSHCYTIITDEQQKAISPALTEKLRNGLDAL